MSTNFNFFLILFCGIFLFSGCDKARVYEEYNNIPENLWSIKNIQKFKFSIDDPNQKYNILYNVRNSAAYPYYNLFLKYTLTDAKGIIISSNLQDLKLMDPKTGEPQGKGMGDIFDNQILSLSSVKFPQKGEYTFAIQQYMRQDPLPDIMSIGIRVEKVE